MKTPPDSWQQFLVTAKKTCSQIAYQNWLEPIQLESIDKNHLLLSVPNVYVKEYLLEHFNDLLTRFFPSEQILFSIHQKKPPVSPNKRSRPRLQLHPAYRFEHFIEGVDNQFVKHSAQSVAKSPSSSYNPLFIYGDAGLGKTHLLHSIAYELQKDRERHIACMTMEGFINEVVHHLTHKSMAKLKKLYRNLDVLLIDDIQFLEKRTNFAEEFCNTIEHLLSQNKQICIVSDKAPALLKIDRRIIARFETGLSCQLVKPQFETKLAILEHKMEQAKIAISQELLSFIASKPFSNIRQIEGVVYRLKAYMSCNYLLDTAERLEQLLYDLIPTQTKKVSLAEITEVVANHFYLKKEELLSSSRAQQVTLARKCAIYLAKELSLLSLNEMSRFFCRTHSTLLHSYKSIQEKAKKEPAFSSQIEKLKMLFR